MGVNISADATSQKRNRRAKSERYYRPPDVRQKNRFEPEENFAFESNQAYIDKYDYIVVFPLTEGAMLENKEKSTERVGWDEVNLIWFQGVLGTEEAKKAAVKHLSESRIFCRIRAPMKLLELQADQDNYRLQLRDEIDPGIDQFWNLEIDRMNESKGKVEPVAIEQEEEKVHFSTLTHPVAYSFTFYCIFSRTVSNIYSQHTYSSNALSTLRPLKGTLHQGRPTYPLITHPLITHVLLHLLTHRLPLSTP